MSEHLNTVIHVSIQATVSIAFAGGYTDDVA